MLVAKGFVPFRYHNIIIVVLANNECLGVDIFEGYFLSLFPEPSILP